MYKYIYSNNSKTLHDENCKYASRISEEHIKSSASWFFFRSREMSFCKCCGYQAVLRENADIAAEELDDCAAILKENGIELEELIKFFRYYKGTMRYKHNVFYLHVSEDQWILDLGRGEITLLHNNYFYNKASNERHFCGGFHEQNLREKTFRSALETVEHYSFRQHVYNNEPTIVLNNLANNMQIVAMA